MLCSARPEAVRSGPPTEPPAAPGPSGGGAHASRSQEYRQTGGARCEGRDARGETRGARRECAVATMLPGGRPAAAGQLRPASCGRSCGIAFPLNAPRPAIRVPPIRVHQAHDPASGRRQAGSFSSRMCTRCTIPTYRLQFAPESRRPSPRNGGSSPCLGRIVHLMERRVMERRGRIRAPGARNRRKLSAQVGIARTLTGDPERRGRAASASSRPRPRGRAAQASAVAPVSTTTPGRRSSSGRPAASSSLKPGPTNDPSGARNSA